MKYCPYCGAELFEGAASFCTECGNALAVNQGAANETEEKTKPKRRGKGKMSNKRKNKAAFNKRLEELLPPEPQLEETDETDDYDGYYADIIPSDLDREKEGVDKELLKKIAVVAGTMLLIIGLCVVAMYLL